MQGDDLYGRVLLGELGGDRFAFAVQECRPGSENCGISEPLRNGVDETVDLAIQLAEPSFEPRALAICIGREAFAFGVVGSHIFGDDVRMAEFGSQAVEDRGFHSLEIEGLRIGTYAALRCRRATNANASGGVLAVARHSRAARATFQQSRQYMAGAPLLTGVSDAASLLALLGGLEKLSADDRQIGNVRRLPFALGVWARNSSAGVRILHHADLVPNEPAHIKFVVQNPVTALHVPIDRGGVPRLAAWRRDLLHVEVMRNVTRRPAVDVIAKNPTDDLCFVLDDRALPGIAGHRSIAIGGTAGIEALAHSSGLSTSHLVGVIFAVELADQPTKADENSIDDAFMHGADFDAEERKSLVNAREIFHVARQAIQRLDDNHVE